MSTLAWSPQACSPALLWLCISILCLDHRWLALFLLVLFNCNYVFFSLFLSFTFLFFWFLFYFIGIFDSLCHCYMFEAEEIHWSINSLCHLDRKLSLLNFFLFIFSFELAIHVHSKTFQSRDIEYIIMFYMPFYFASQQMINNLTEQLLYTNWLNSPIINFITW